MKNPGVITVLYSEQEHFIWAKAKQASLEVPDWICGQRMLLDVLLLLT